MNSPIDLIPYEIGQWETARRLSGYSRHPEVDYASLPEPWQPLLEALDTSANMDPGEIWEACMQSNPDRDELLRAVFRVDPSSPMPTLSSASTSIQATIAALGIPELPETACLTPQQEQQAATAGTLLDRSNAFMHQASPLTPCSFHTAAMLFAISLVIARRIHLAVSTKSNYIRPNLYVLYIGPSTRDRKTTAFNVLRGLLNAAGLNYLLLPERQSPEGLLRDMTITIPPDYDTWSPEEQSTWLLERAYAAQRGLMLEEASHLFDSLGRDYSAALLPLLLELADSKDIGPRRITIGRGRESIQNVYLSIFGVSTYGAMAPHMRNPAYWHNGLFARFALVGSDGTGNWQFWKDPLDYPQDLVDKLRFIATQLLPVPSAEIKERSILQGKETRTVKHVEITPVSSLPIRLEPAAWKHWELYSKAVSWDMLPEIPTKVPTRFYANYGRLGTMLIKVAMLLATLDTKCLPITVEARHVYRAQQIVESWRASLHSLDIHLSGVAQDGLAERIRSVLSKEAWVSRRDLLRALGKTWSELAAAINDLEASGDLERQSYKPTRGAASEEYRLC